MPLIAPPWRFPATIFSLQRPKTISQLGGAVYRRPLDAQVPFVPVGAGLPRWTDGIVDTGCIAARDSELTIADKGGNLYICAGAEWAWSRCPDRIPAPSSLLIV